MRMFRKHTGVPNPGVAGFIGFAAQTKPVQFESAGASALHIPPFGFNLGDAAGTQGRGVLITQFGQCCRSVGAQSATQPSMTSTRFMELVSSRKWHIGPPNSNYIF